MYDAIKRCKQTFDFQGKLHQGSSLEWFWKQRILVNWENISFFTRIRATNSDISIWNSGKEFTRWPLKIFSHVPDSNIMRGCQEVQESLDDEGWRSLARVNSGHYEHNLGVWILTSPLTVFNKNLPIPLSSSSPPPHHRWQHPSWRWGCPGEISWPGLLVSQTQISRGILCEHNCNVLTVASRDKANNNKMELVSQLLRRAVI